MKYLLQSIYWLIGCIFVIAVTTMFFYCELPIKYTEEIEFYSQKYKISPSLVFAVIKTESGFDRNAISHAGAIGLMQVMPKTAQQIANELKISEFNLCAPKTNINFGCYYLSQLLSRYANEKTALAAYNAGSGNADRWLKNKAFSDDGITLKSIPFPETDNYVRKVFIYRTFYTKLFNI